MGKQIRWGCAQSDKLRNVLQMDSILRPLAVTSVEQGSAVRGIAGVGSVTCVSVGRTNDRVAAKLPASESMLDR